MFEVWKEQCHGDHFVVDSKQTFEDYESAKAVYDALVEKEAAKTPQYNYKQKTRYYYYDTQDEHTIFHIDRDDSNFCDIILSEV